MLLDPQVLDPSGKTNVDWFVPSPDGKLVVMFSMLDKMPSMVSWLAARSLSTPPMVF